MLLNEYRDISYMLDDSSRVNSSGMISLDSASLN